jgi:hypothetical protein
MSVKVIDIQAKTAVWQGRMMYVEHCEAPANFIGSNDRDRGSLIA